VANDGKADKLIMATELLNARLKKIMCYRNAKGLDPTPTLVDIERTHILYVNAHFKPFASIGYEYDKVLANTGNPQLGSQVQFSIPQFGDFFNDMVINVQLSAVSATVGTVPAFPPFIGASNQVTTSTSQVSGLINTTTGVYTQYTQQYIDGAGNILTVGAAASNFVKYCDYPGARVFQHVYFDVNNNPLDDYTAEAMLFYSKHNVAPGKRVGWMRLMGQEVPLVGYTQLQSIAGVVSNPVSGGLIDQSGNPAPGSRPAAVSTTRQQVSVCAGAQTAQATQPALSLWVPLIFWFNKDVRLSIASVAIPYGQRFITIDLEQLTNLVFVAPGNLFLQLTVEEQVSADGATKGTAAAVAVQNVIRSVTKTPVLATGSVVNTATGGISNISLYINNIFVNSEIHDIYIKRIGFSLIRLHRFQASRVNTATDQVLLNQFKYPIETIYVGMRPAYNIDPTNPNQARDWYQLARLTDQFTNVTSTAGGAVMTDDTVAYNASSIKHKTFLSTNEVDNITYPVATQTVDTLQLQVHGITIYDIYASAFYRDFLYWRYGKADEIITSDDIGSMMLNFALLPGQYQPSGHMNVSRAREFYVNYTSSYVSTGTPADLLTLGVAINFLLISDGSAVIRYST
jgi:hypothetical protein